MSRRGRPRRSTRVLANVDVERQPDRQAQTRSSRRWWWYAAAAAVVLVIAGGAIYWLKPGLIGLGSSSANQAGAGPNSGTSASGGPVVPVQTTTVERQILKETAVAYGRVVAQPGETDVSSLPFEVLVRRVLVTDGQPVTAGTPLVEVSSSPSANLQLEHARQASDAAQEQLAQVQQQYKQRLAVKQDLVRARKSAEQAKTTLENLQKQGVGRDTTLTAQSAGVVSHVSAQEGALVGPGGPLVTVARGDRIEVKVGVEPEDIATVHEGDLVTLAPVHLKGSAVTGQVRLVTRQVDPNTQLIDVMVALPKDASFALGAYMRATLTTAARTGLVVPRSAVLPDDGGYKVFTVRNGKAVKHPVGIGLETDFTVEITTSDLHPGDKVVLTGNYELQPGMSVSLKGNE